MDVKPGYKTTEFWLSLLAVIVGLLIASGAIAEASSLGKILALAASALATLGYTYVRGTTKTKGGNGG